MRAQEREVYMPTHKPHPIEVRLHRIQETLEHKPNRDDVENWSSDLTVKLEELHDDVRDLQSELAEVRDQGDDLHGELAQVKDQIEDLQSEDR
jgi:predicted  nucleic acid-binding Zn-ribbon protein